jgi:CTP synthase (UTP-ammonia lyase)
MADIVEVDAATGDVTERPFTAAEKAQRTADAKTAADVAAVTAAQEAATAGAQASTITKLAALGFTADEIVVITPADVDAARVESVMAADAEAL